MGLCRYIKKDDPDNTQIAFHLPFSERRDFILVPASCRFAPVNNFFDFNLQGFVLFALVLTLQAVRLDIFNPTLSSFAFPPRVSGFRKDFGP